MNPRKPLEPGTRFGYLTVLPDEPISKMVGTSNPRKTIFYHCKCDCGNEVWCKRSNLVSGTKRSCGCRTADRSDSTIILKRGQNKTVSSNKTGHTGVKLFKNGKYVAYFTYKGKYNHVGYFKTIEEAVKAREKAISDIINR